MLEWGGERKRKRERERERARRRSYFGMDGCILSNCRPTTRNWEIHKSVSAQVPIFPDKKCSTSMTVVIFIFQKIIPFSSIFSYVI
jgi:hypothetical protein